jgi:AraC family transcriptional regulator
VKTCHRRLQVGGFEVLEQGYAPGYRSARHDHAAAEFCLVLAGALTETVDHGAALACHSGAASFKPAAARHRVAGGPAGAHCLVVTVPVDRLRDVTGAGGALGRLASFPPGTLAGVGARLLRELAADDACAPLAAEGLALELLATAARQGGRADAARIPPWVRAVRDRLHDAAPAPGAAAPSLGELASAVGVTPTRLAQAFRRAYGTSVGAYLRRIKLARARELLLTDEHSLAAVALACGFYDQSHFTRCFRRETGLTPDRYRREHRSG